MNNWTLLATITFIAVFAGSYQLLSRHTSHPSEPTEINPDISETVEFDFDEENNLENLLSEDPASPQDEPNTPPASTPELFDQDEDGVPLIEDDGLEPVKPAQPKESPVKPKDSLLPKTK